MVVLMKLVKDIFETLNSEYFEKLVDEYLALKLFQIVQNHLDAKARESRTGSNLNGILDEDK